MQMRSGIYTPRRPRTKIVLAGDVTDGANVDVVKCCHSTLTGGACHKAASIITNGKPLCKLHHNFDTRNGDCIICLDPMNNTSERTKLGCGHYFHTNCLSKCEKPECPVCRTKWDPRLIDSLFYGTRVQPDLYRVYEMGANHVTSYLGLHRSMVDFVTTASSVAELQLMTTYIEAGIQLFTNIRNTPDPINIMGDVAEMVIVLDAHLNATGGFDGAGVEGEGTRLYTWTVDEAATVAEVADMEMGQDPVDAAEDVLVPAMGGGGGAFDSNNASVPQDPYSAVYGMGPAAFGGGFPVNPRDPRFAVNGMGPNPLQADAVGGSGGSGGGFGVGGDAVADAPILIKCESLDEPSIGDVIPDIADSQGIVDSPGIPGIADSPSIPAFRPFFGFNNPNHLWEQEFVFPEHSGSPSPPPIWYMV